MKEKLYHVNQLKDGLSEHQYRLVAATVISNYYVDRMKQTGRKLDRMSMLERVNLTLKGLGLEEVSYGFLRTVM